MQDSHQERTGAWRLRGTLVAGLLALASGTGIALLPGLPAARAGDGCCGGGGGHEGGHGSDPAPQDDGKTQAPEGGHSGHGGGGASSNPSPGTGLLVDLANAKCPIMGGKPNGSTWSEWNGLRIGHCCGMCPSKFAADPEKMLKRAGIEWKAAAAAVQKVKDAKTEEDRAAAMKALRAKWLVVREPEPLKPGLLVELANEKCPIMGGKPDGKTFSEWNGLRIGHCCGMCPSKFAADPEGALKKAGVEWKPAADAVKKVNEAKTAEEREKALKALGAKWKVVREPAPMESTK